MDRLSKKNYYRIIGLSAKNEFRSNSIMHVLKGVCDFA